MSKELVISAASHERPGRRLQKGQVARHSLDGAHDHPDHTDNHVEDHHEDAHAEDASPDEHGSGHEELHAGGESHGHEESQPEPAEERQPASNASAPQNFAPHYNPTQKYAPR